MIGGKGKWLSAIGAFALISFGVFGAASAWGAERLFDAELSLTGGCTTTTADPIPDPGCPEGTHPGPFVEPQAILVDAYGNFYVSSYGKEVEGKLNGRIDIFSPAGVFLTSIKDPRGPSSLAVDSKGNLYVMESASGVSRVSRLQPTLYNPAAHEIAYSEIPVTVVEKEESKFGTFFLSNGQGIAVDPADDHLFVDFEKHISEYSSAEEGNKLLHEDEPIGQGTLQLSRKIAIDGVRRRLYASDYSEALGRDLVRVFDLDSPYELLETIDGSEVPAGKFVTIVGNQSIAVDEETGDFFIDDIPKANKVYEFNAAYQYVSAYTHSLENGLSEIEVDNGVTSANRGALFVPSIKEGSHAYVFKLKETCPPKVEAISAGEVTEDEAELHGRVNPCGLETTYRLEYVTQQQFGESLWVGATKAGEGTLSASKVDIDVSAIAMELEPGTAYRFRVVAENGEGGDEEEGTFTTFGTAEPPPEPCGNEVLRTAFSATLPDCRAFELVTPSDTGGRTPVGVGFVGNRFSTREASSLGEKVSFVIEGGSIPGSEGTGSFNGDPYLASREGQGWVTANAGPNGAESESPNPGSVSADQDYSFWTTSSGFDQGSKVIGEKNTKYIRYPNGNSELVGRGSLDTDPYADGKFISKNGTHIIFQTGDSESAVQLEPDAPPDGTAAIYDRTVDEVTHVVSLPPGDEPQKAGENATYLGASEDGEGIAFSIGGTIYVRLHNTETLEVAGPGSAFAGIAEEGKRVFYLEGGDLFAYDTAAEETIAFSESGDVTPVNVASGGTRAYLVSPSVLTPEPNPEGEEAEAGRENLYLSEGEGQFSFVGIVTERDVEGESRPDGQVGGLGLWRLGLNSGRMAIDPSRTTPSGQTFLFESRANLIGYDPEGFAQVYRYDQVQNRLTCLSCSPTRLPPGSDASLESIAPSQGALEPFSSFGFVANLRTDGRRAIFQSSEALVLSDTDGLQDVYEWEDEGVGSCRRAGGCVYLLSSGHSASNDYLYAVSESGNDVFFRTADQLTRADSEATPSIYDARVGGGFPEGEICEGEGCCGGEACRPQPTPPPPLPAPESNEYGPGGNVVQHKPRKHCPKGTHRVKRGGKVRCVKRHHRRGHRR